MKKDFLFCLDLYNKYIESLACARNVYLFTSYKGFPLRIHKTFYIPLTE